MDNNKLMNYVESIRHFNRIYAQVMNILDPYSVHPVYTNTEMRMLYEIKSMHQPTANTLVKNWRVDPGYVSRVLAKFVRDKLITKQELLQDKRTKVLILTEKGEECVQKIIHKANSNIIEGLQGLKENDFEDLVDAMKRIQEYIT
ncbi:MAG TPA: hypothetical protein DIW17_19295 [Clostridiales bacterium]|jgi:DNA-binding MarR family transcriptional regulator|nr:hypothetical protein [Clostridiales bacterium]